MHIPRRCLSLLLFTLILTGCSYVQNSQMLRNRTYDYTQENVVNLPTLQTPPDLATPPYKPELTLPAGQNDYPPGSPPNMTPPGFNTFVPIPALPPKAKPANS